MAMQLLNADADALRELLNAICNVAYSASLVENLFQEGSITLIK
jgi:hypothetical protein